jgi:hypothetical protein
MHCGRVTLLISLTGCLTTIANAQVSRFDEQTYLAASHNRAFRNRYRAVDDLFNAFDYGHAILYETLYATPHAPLALLEEQRFTFITTKLLPHPPGVTLEERAIAPAFARLAPEIVAMFEWAHALHRQIYDVWADERIPTEKKDQRVAELVRYYRSRADLALSATPKAMELMEGQPYSNVFRARYPRFNGLIWSYHWLQMALYDAMLPAQTPEARAANVYAARSHFQTMVACAPDSFPSTMPMSAAIAPLFSERYPDAAIIFDNLHSMHDVISDILVSDRVPRSGKRAAILQAAARYRDDTSHVTTRSEWRTMSRSMGVQSMGGVFVSPVDRPGDRLTPWPANCASAVR